MRPISSPRVCPRPWLAGAVATALQLLSFGAAAQAADSPAPAPGIFEGLWLWRTPTSTTLLIIVLILILSALVGIALYRVLLRRQVKQGVHPHVLGWTLGFFVAGFDLWAVFALLYARGFIGLGIPALWFALFLFLVVMMLVLGRVRKWLVFFLILIAALIVFQVMTA